MILTEAEAKTKWCPHARVIVPITEAETNEMVDTATGNRIDNGKVPKNSKCIGSSCMAWRWRMYLQAEPDQHSRGYCGLSGRPA